MIVAMWSGPRNLSTAMMRSFDARADTAVLDEPYFAPFLAETGKDHPGRAETLAAHETDATLVANLCAAHGLANALSFQKHMPHHMLPIFPTDWAAGAKHFFLTRHPARVIASYAKGRATFAVEDLGFGPQRQLWERFGRPPVVDCDDILADPESVLKALCSAIDISFDVQMLEWASGPRPEDGAWAPYWYASVERSTGFGTAPGPLPPVDTAYQKIFENVLPDYTAMAKARLRPS